MGKFSVFQTIILITWRWFLNLRPRGVNLDVDGAPTNHLSAQNLPLRRVTPFLRCPPRRVTAAALAPTPAEPDTVVATRFIIGSW